jgi:hypothetical protein
MHRIDAHSTDPTKWVVWSRWPAYSNPARAGLYYAVFAVVILVAAEAWALLAGRRLPYPNTGALALAAAAQFLVWPSLCLAVAGLIRALRYAVCRVKRRTPAT